MNNHLDIKRLSIALRELWLSNKTLVFSLPFVMLLSFLVFYLWPDGIFYKKLSAPEVTSSSSYWNVMMLTADVTHRVLILFVPPIYVIICTGPFLYKLNKSERINLTPISQLERTLASTVFAIGIICLGTTCFMVYDYASVSWFKHLYLDQVLYYLERQGNLYPNIRTHTIFHTIPLHGVGRVFQIMFFSLPLYMLSMVFFKKYSFLWFWGLMIVIWAVLLVVLSSLPRVPHDSETTTVLLQQGIPRAISIFLTTGYWCVAMATFYYKCKEKEI